MRFLHTSDWHVGKALRGRQRGDEFRAVLSEVCDIAVNEGVDAVLLAGDLYEHRAPSPEADHIVFDTLLRLYEEQIPVVIIPGNHDSPTRLQAFAKLLRPLGVRIVPLKAEQVEDWMVEVPSRSGDDQGLVSCLPFVPERLFGDASSVVLGAAEWTGRYIEGVTGVLTELERRFRPDHVNVVISHLFVDGAKLGGGEKEVTIGPQFAVPPSRLPGTAAYVGLGHLHKPQAVRGAPSSTRYSGSLLQLDFGEVNQDKSVVIVEAVPGAPAKAREVPLRSGRRLIDMVGTLDELEARAAEAGDAFVRAKVRTDGPIPGIAEMVRAFLPNAVEVRPEYERSETPERGPLVSTLHARDQFLAYHLAAHGAEPHPGLLEAFDEVHATVSEED